MTDVLIRNMPKRILAEAKILAEFHRRPLQKELQLILEEGVRFRSGAWIESAKEIQRKLKRGSKKQTDSVRLIAEDRKR